MSNKNKFISLLNDVTFKYMWKNEDYRSVLEELLYEISGIDLNGYELIDNELNEGQNTKAYKVDILLKKDNSILNIEMNQYIKDYTMIKNHSYLYRIAGNVYKKGEIYDKYFVYQINFNNCYCKENKDVKMSIFEFCDKDNDLVIEGIKDYEIYLKTYKGKTYMDGKKEMLLSLFTCESYDDMIKVVGDDEKLKKVIENLETLSQDKYFGGLYDNRIIQKKLENSARKYGYDEGKALGMKEGMKEGIKEGEQKERINIVKNMLKENIDVSTISKITNLSTNEIEKLAKS